MELNEKISNLTEDNAVQELTKLLDKNENIKVTISWWGQRLVSIEGYEGHVTINQLARKYLTATTFDIFNNRDCEKRLKCDTLWTKVEKLYTDSDKVLSKTWIYKYFVPLIEFFKRNSNAPQRAIREKASDFRNKLFLFKPLEFQRYFKSLPHKGEFSISDEEGATIRWLASREMVQSIVNNSKLIQELQQRNEEQQRSAN